ncbi:MAG TPA: ABC transporter ATP-binding protein [Acidimicrobiia bacterium]|nr:ABC transporter ATP-binding protein [Acidimicrobiia bacterium]
MTVVPSSIEPRFAAVPRVTALEVHRVSKTYGDGRSAIAALDDVSLTVAEGEFVCLVGASGCGKSTLLNLIAGIYHLDHGSILIGDRRVGLMFQEPALFPWLTVQRNVESAMRFRQSPLDKAKVRQLLEIVHLEEFADRRPHELSGGMQQRAALARALAQDADILLMDEPFGALDAMTRTVLHDELERIWQATGVSIVFVTHDVREAVRLGDRVILLSSRPGRVVDEVQVPLERPRRLDSASVNDIAQEVTDRLRQQVRHHGG